MPMREVWESVKAQLWEIWARNRTAGWWLIGVVACLVVLNFTFHDSIKVAESNPQATGFPLLIALLGQNLAGAALLLCLTILGCTEFNSQDDTRGFPRRLFVLPVSSLQLVTVPMIAGVVGTELLLLLWMVWGKLLEHSDWNTSLLVLTPVYVVVYQTILWTMPWLRSMRLLIVGIVAMFFIMAPALPVFGSPMMRGGPRTSILEFFVALGFAAFFTSWVCVARQRSGGGSVSAWAASWVVALIARPRRERVFRSSEAAQAWFEWRRSGGVLPAVVGGLLVAAIGPWSLFRRDDAGTSLFILIATLVMPMVLASPIGKAFSKPDFWSVDLGVPAIVAVRPLDGADMIAIKVRVAAKSAVLSWAYTLVFLGIWLPLWADRTAIDRAWRLLWEINGHSVYREYGMAVLSIAAGILLTWRFLVGSLWLGLRGNKKLFTVSALPYVLVPFPLLAGVYLTVTHKQFVLSWIQHHLGSVLPQLEWIAAIAVILKLSAAVWSWRNIPAERIRAYFLIWAVATLLLIAFAVMMWSYLPFSLPSDTYRLRTVMVLMAIMFLPLARIGLASSSFAKNRHRI